MEANECFIASVGKDWHKISNCNVPMNVKRRLQRTVIRGGQPWFHDPFEERQMKALFLSIDYDSATGAYEFILMEDAEQSEIKS